MMNSKITIIIVLYCLGINHASEIFNMDGRSYFISQPQKETWFNAFRYCSHIGRYLVDIRNDFEQSRLNAVLTALSARFSTTEQYWTSATDMGKQGIYSFVSTGQPALYTNWRPGQPDNSFSEKYNQTENCVTILGTTGEWNDAFCADKYYFICRDTLDVPTYKNHGCSHSDASK